MHVGFRGGCRRRGLAGAGVHAGVLFVAPKILHMGILIDSAANLTFLLHCKSAVSNSVNFRSIVPKEAFF
jgi:hypothetical protein